MAASRIRLSSIGGNGFKMLLISLFAMFGTAGLSLLAVQFHVWRVARRTGTVSSNCRQLLVLGLQLEQGRCSEGFRHRLQRAKQLLESGTGEAIYILGGVTSADGPSEAAAGRDYLLEQGCEDARIFLEERSRHTLENLQQVRSLLGDELDFTLITSRYHLARSAAMARAMGLQPRLCAAENALQLSPSVVSRLILEGFLLHWYYSGYYWAHLVGDSKSLERIR